jgi:hypothetical protein
MGLGSGSTAVSRDMEASRQTNGTVTVVIPYREKKNCDVSCLERPDSGRVGLGDTRFPGYLLLDPESNLRSGTGTGNRGETDDSFLIPIAVRGCDIH